MGNVSSFVLTWVKLKHEIMYPPLWILRVPTHISARFLKGGSTADWFGAKSRPVSHMYYDIVLCGPSYAFSLYHLLWRIITFILIKAIVALLEACRERRTRGLVGVCWIYVTSPDPPNAHFTAYDVQNRLAFPFSQQKIKKNVTVLSLHVSNMPLNHKQWE